jgi:hypothetical protein
MPLRPHTFLLRPPPAVVFTLLSKVPANRSSAAITLWMENEVHQVFTDFFSISFNIKFHRLLKFVLLLPFTLMALLVGWTASAHGSAALPLGGHGR